MCFLDSGIYHVLVYANVTGRPDSAFAKLESGFPFALIKLNLFGVMYTNLMRQSKQIYR